MNLLNDYQLLEKFKILGSINLINFLIKVKNSYALKLHVASMKSIYNKFVQIFDTFNLKNKIYWGNKHLRDNIYQNLKMVMNGCRVEI